MKKVVFPMSSQITQPSVIFKPHTKKRQLIPYNAERAMELLMKRDPLPQVFQPSDNISEIPEGMVVRTKLVIKHNSAADLMYYTRSDDG